MRIAFALAFILYFVLSPLSVSSQYYFKYTEDSRKIYTQILNLELDYAQQLIEKYQTDHPNDLSYIHLASYIDFFTLFISEDEQAFKKLENNRKKWIDTLEKNLSDDDPYKAYAVAEIKLQWAIIRSKFGQLFKSSREILNAYKQLQDNKEKHPDFIYNLKSLSIIHSLIETITLPGIVKKVFGLKGSIELGIKEIEAMVAHSQSDSEFIFREEVDAIYLYLLVYQANDTKQAQQYLDQVSLRPNESPMASFLMATIYDKLGQTDLALEVMAMRPDKETPSAFHFLDFKEGLLKLRQLDPTSVLSLEKFVSEFGGRHYIKEAYQKLAWAALVFDNDLAAYKNYMNKVQNSGQLLIDGDKQAQHEAESKLIPDPILIQSRLLCDGGYHHKAYVLLSQNAFRYQADNLDRIEFYYRLGRITQALKNYPEAIDYFEATLENKTYQNEYFVCNAAIQLALIYESQKKYKLATHYLNHSLQLDPNNYKNSLHQKAKSGLLRVEEKSQL